MLTILNLNTCAHTVLHEPCGKYLKDHSQNSGTATSQWRRQTMLTDIQRNSRWTNINARVVNIYREQRLLDTSFILALTLGNVGFSLSQELKLEYSEYRLSKFIALDFVVHLPVNTRNILTEVLCVLTYWVHLRLVSRNSQHSNLYDHLMFIIAPTNAHIICLFVFGTTAPCGPGPPHSRGF